MKAFRVAYKTKVYRVLAETVLVKDEADIPAYLVANSTKGFFLEDPECAVLKTEEIAIENLPIRELSVGQLYQLIDSRVALRDGVSTETGGVTQYGYPCT